MPAFFAFSAINLPIAAAASTLPPFFTFLRTPASTVEASVRKSIKNGGNIEAAAAIGKLIAEKAIIAGITTVAFDRSGYKYHGRIKALADAAREHGLSF